MVRFKEATKICLSKILEQGVVKKVIENTLVPPYTPPIIPKEVLEEIAVDTAGVSGAGLLIGIFDGYKRGGFSVKNIVKGYVAVMVIRYLSRAIEYLMNLSSLSALMVNPLIFLPFYAFFYGVGYLAGALIRWAREMIIIGKIERKLSSLDTNGESPYVYCKKYQNK